MNFRKATTSDFYQILEIIEFAKEDRKKAGSKQWQDGYPNEQSIKSDIERKVGYVFYENNEVLFYCAIIFDIEPTYQKIKGKWLTENQEYCVMHRLAVSSRGKGRGLANLAFEKIEEISKKRQVYSIKIDTNFDNEATLYLLNKFGYSYCGEIKVRGESRKAFEKVCLKK